MSENLTLFSEEQLTRMIPEPNPMARKFGRLNTWRTCQACRFLHRTEHHDKKYYKCFWRGESHGAGTDHRVGWFACKKFEENSER